MEGFSAYLQMGKIILCFGELDWLVPTVQGINLQPFGDVRISSPTECDRGGKLTLLTVIGVSSITTSMQVATMRKCFFVIMHFNSFCCYSVGQFVRRVQSTYIHPQENHKQRNA